MQGAAQTLAVILSSMCTIAILLEVVPGVPLVIAANRDEIYARPTRPPARFASGVVGGVDALSGGTWLAVTRSGGFAAVTNQRVLQPAPAGVRSRGLAVLELAAADDRARYVAALDPADYASMNLAWGDARGAHVAYLRREGVRDVDGRGSAAAGSAAESRRGEIDGRGSAAAGSAAESRRGEIVALAPGIHVLCNDRLGAAGFPRGERLHDAIARAPKRWPDLVPALQAALADHTHAPADPSPLPPALAYELTATCIHSPHYGTRSSTIFAAGPDGALAYLHADGPPCTTPFVDHLELL
jgi:uncharacterized protein with NRDE domain